MIVIGHQAVGDKLNGLWRQILAQLAQEIQVVLALEEDGLEVVAPVVQVIIFTGSEFDVAVWHGLFRNPASQVEKPVFSKKTGF